MQGTALLLHKVSVTIALWIQGLSYNSAMFAIQNGIYIRAQILLTKVEVPRRGRYIARCKLMKRRVNEQTRDRKWTQPACSCGRGLVASSVNKSYEGRLTTFWRDTQKRWGWWWLTQTVLGALPIRARQPVPGGWTPTAIGNYCACTPAGFLLPCSSIISVESGAAGRLCRRRTALLRGSCGHVETRSPKCFPSFHLAEVVKFAVTFHGCTPHDLRQKLVHINWNSSFQERGTRKSKYFGFWKREEYCC